MSKGIEIVECKKIVTQKIYLDSERETIIRNVFGDSLVLDTAIKRKCMLENVLNDPISGNYEEFFTSDKMQFQYYNWKSSNISIYISAYFDKKRIIADCQKGNNQRIEIESYDELKLLIEELSKSESHMDTLIARVNELQELGFTFGQKEKSPEIIKKKSS